MIHTKRVNRQRIGSDPFSRRVFNAAGSWNTVYLTLFAGVAGHQLRQVMNTTRHTLWWTALPAALAFGFGVHTFGNPNEYRKLSVHFGFYKKEMHNYKQELYYS